MTTIDCYIKERDRLTACEPPRVVSSSWLSHGDRLRVLAASAVVVLHVAGEGVIHYGSISMMGWWVCNVADSFCRWVVPVFVMLSGALLLHPGKEESLPLFFRKRVSRVAIPFVFWTAFYLLLEAFYTKRNFSIRSAVEDTLAGVPYYHLHFMFIIAGLYLFTPAIRVFLKHADQAVQLYFVVIAFALSAGDMLVRVHQGHDLNAFSRFLPYTGYYCAGYLLRDRILSPASVRRAWIAFLGAASLTIMGVGWLAAVKGLSVALMVYDPLCPPTIVMSVCVFLISGSISYRNGGVTRPRSSAMRILADSTLGVYLIHPALLGFLHRHGVTAVVPNVWLGTFGASIVVVIGSFALATSIQRIPYVRRVI